MKSNKRTFVEISSSSDESDSEPEDAEDSVVEISSSDSSDDDGGDGGDWDEEEYEEKEDGNDDDDDMDDDDDVTDVQVNDESLCNKVIKFLRERDDLQELNLVECKAYLRRHGLRLSGTKSECIERIKEHWRIKDRNCEALYPRSSFTIDCTGDVCKGDVVLFNQKVYKNFEKMTRRGIPLGKRTIAGRIVKENYGAAKQQHTFTVEVLWSKGPKKLPLLFPLLVKGRNLYKLRTFRQRWRNEKERLNVLAEKHKRGAAARSLRAKRKAKAEKKTNKSHTSRGMKRHKPLHHAEPSGTKETGCMPTKRVNVNELANSLKGNQKSLHRHHSASPLRTLNSKQKGDFRGPEIHWKRPNLIQSNRIEEPPVLPYSYHHFDSNLYNQRGDNHYPSHRVSTSALRLPHFQPLSNSASAHVSESLDRLPHFLPLSNSASAHVSESLEFGHSRYNYYPRLYPNHVPESRKFDRFPRLMNSHAPSYLSPNDASYRRR